jgi:hypothetical protein
VLACDMQIRYFGDSYDIVKQSLLRWLGVFGKWSVHPMFTELVSPESQAAFEAFLSAPIISKTVLTNRTDRTAYFAPAASCGHLLLDPDVGLRLIDKADRKRFLFADELVGLVKSRPAYITIVFDQSLCRGFERTKLEEKIAYLRSQGVGAFAYHSHASFIIASADRALVARAYDTVVLESHLPNTRFIESISTTG